MKSKDSNSKKSVSYQKKDGRGHARPSFFGYDNDKDLKVCFLVTQVMFGLSLIQLELDEEGKRFVTSMWSVLTWLDAHMVWSPAQYAGVQSVQIETQHIWVPDVMLSNTADTEVSMRHAQLTVFSSGFVVWQPHTIYKSYCPCNVQAYPFDRQVCDLVFMSWSYPTSKMELSMADDRGIGLKAFNSDYKDASGWNIFKQEANRKREGRDSKKYFFSYLVSLNF